MEYRSLCQMILEADPNIVYTFLVNSEARLVAFTSGPSAKKIGEDRFAELMEDLLFTVSSRKHYEDLFGAVQFVHIKHTRANTYLFPFERDKILCVCLERQEYNETEFLAKLQKIMPIFYKYARNQASGSESEKFNYGFAMNRYDV